MQQLKRLRVVGWRDVLTRLLVVGPEREHDPVVLIDTRFHSGLKTRHGAPNFSKSSSNLEFGLEYLNAGECHSGEDVARQQAQSELVRILKNRRFGDCHLQRRGDLLGRVYRTYNV
jgi:hypothetical protein